MKLMQSELHSQLLMTGVVFHWRAITYTFHQSYIIIATKTYHHIQITLKIVNLFQQSVLLPLIKVMTVKSRKNSLLEVINARLWGLYWNLCWWQSLRVTELQLRHPGGLRLCHQQGWSVAESQYRANGKDLITAWGARTRSCWLLTCTCMTHPQY